MVLLWASGTGIFQFPLSMRADFYCKHLEASSALSGLSEDHVCYSSAVCIASESIDSENPLKPSLELNFASMPARLLATSTFTAWKASQNWWVPAIVLRLTAGLGFGFLVHPGSLRDLSPKVVKQKTISLADCLSIWRLDSWIVGDWQLVACCFSGGEPSAFKTETGATSLLRQCSHGRRARCFHRLCKRHLNEEKACDAFEGCTSKAWGEFCNKSSKSNRRARFSYCRHYSSPEANCFREIQGSDSFVLGKVRYSGGASGLAAGISGRLFT